VRDEQYPRGKLKEDDQGALELQIAVAPSNQTLVIDFGKPVVWIGLGKQEVLDLAKLLKDKAESMEEA
jgi:hypothetical protein